MGDGPLLAYMGADAAKWAAEFCKIARDKGHTLDEGWMLGWFANAIEAGRENRVSHICFCAGGKRICSSDCCQPQIP